MVPVKIMENLMPKLELEYGLEIIIPCKFSITYKYIEVLLNCFRNISKPVIGKATNNTAEIQACIEALQTIKDKGITLYYIF